MAKESGAKIPFPFLPEALGLPDNFNSGCPDFTSGADKIPSLIFPFPFQCLQEAGKEMIFRIK